MNEEYPNYVGDIYPNSTIELEGVFTKEQLQELVANMTSISESKDIKMQFSMPFEI